MEVTFFERQIFLVQKFDIKVKSIVAQLKDGTIIYNQAIKHESKNK